MSATLSKLFRPWTYAPPVGLVVALRASLNILLGNSFSISATLAAYLYALRRLSGEHAGAVFTVLFPSILLTILTGQNGFLTAALIGMSCALLLANSPWAGATLGLMAIKPHLAVTLGVHAVVTGNWRVVAIAAATVIATSLAATLAFGPNVWLAFLGSVREAQTYLGMAAYPMHRMVSVYATLCSLGLSADVSFAIQMAVSLAAVAAVVVISLKRLPQRETLGLAVFLGLFVSPYACDYDLPVLGVALALLLPAIVRRATALDEALIMALAWSASFWGFGMQRAHQYFGVELTSANNGPSLGGLFLLMLLALVCNILSREPSRCRRVGLACRDHLGRAKARASQNKPVETRLRSAQTRVLRLHCKNAPHSSAGALVYISI